MPWRAVKVEQAAMAKPAPPQPGFFGKLPARGDFVGRRLDQAFRTGFDEWLQRSIATSQRQLGSAWLPAYLNTPIWRFVLGPGLCGDAPTLGVMIPSVDRVGRYFPLVLAAQLPGCLTPGTLFHSARDWFDAAERLILTALDDDFDFDSFDRRVLDIGVPPYVRAGDNAPSQAVRLDLNADGDMASTYAHILDRVLMGNNVAFSLWWTLGSDTVRASVLLGSGMPAPPNFAAFLDGRWDEWGWERPGGSTTIDEFPLLLLRPLVALPSAGRTHPGTRRPHNEDALLLRPDLGIWAVADGVGGHDAADVASRIVVEQLDELLSPLSFRSAVDEVIGLLTDANTTLRHRAAMINDTAVVASTVVVLLTYAGHFCVLWSGDSRAYRYSDGKLERLTHDHAVSKGGMVTHAIGAAQDAFIETVHGTIEPGDMFLLCSDGIIKALDDGDLAVALAGREPGPVVDGLIHDSLVAGAQDNITAVVVCSPES
jgi:type VI secretion system protein ImpM